MALGICVNLCYFVIKVCHFLFLYYHRDRHKTSSIPRSESSCSEPVLEREGEPGTVQRI